MSAKYHPTATDYQTVVDWLTGQGFKIVHQDSNHLAVFANGSVNQIQWALRANFARVSHHGQTFSSAVVAPSLPAEIASLVVGINGLQPHIQLRKHFILKPASLTSENPPYLPIQLATAYNANGLYSSNITGAGQTIAIVIDTFPNTSDLQNFWSLYGVDQSLNNISFIQVVPGTLPAPSGEETLDTEWSSAIAPGAKVRVYASQSLDFTAIDQCYAQIYNDVTAHPEWGLNQLSMSFGAPENIVSTSQLQTDAQYFAALASAGVTVFASSGDWGADPDGKFGVSGGSPSPLTPSCDPNVTAIGGTSLYVDANGTASNEFVWNNVSGATGGGISAYFARPAWQTGLGVPDGAMRVVPDVSSAADPYTGAVVILNGFQGQYGGTSWSSPTWAAFCALLNQSRAQNHTSSLGLLGPYLYPSINTNIFRDITVGNNAFNGGFGYNAAAGYDLATGVGVPNLSILAQSIAGYSPPANQAPSLTSGTPPSAASTTSAYSFTFTATGFPEPIFTLTSGSLPAGMNLSLSGLLSGTPTQTGDFAVTVTASNGIDPSPTQTFTLNVTAPPSPPAFTNISPPTSVTIGSLFGFTYSASGYPHPSFNVSSGALPPGLTLTALGLVSGSPTQLGTFSGVITASNGNSPDATQGFSITIVPNPLQQMKTICSLETVSATLSAQDALGNFYASCTRGGATDKGALIQITPAGTQITLHSFSDGSVPNDGIVPNGVIFGNDGNLYGTTFQGGAAGNMGTVFGISPQGTEAILHRFNDGSVAGDGQLPGGKLTLGADGSFYGTTSQGGNSPKNSGTFFKITPQGSLTILHNFPDDMVANDGRVPYGKLIQSREGDFYGTTYDGGSSAFFTIGYGSIFRMTPSGTVTILHGFGDGSVPNDGQNPQTGLVQDLNGCLYGTTNNGGIAGQGTIFSLTQAGQYTVLHSFGDGTVANDASTPTPVWSTSTSSLLEGPDGNYYGVTEFGGYANLGALFQINPSGAITIMHSFGDGTIGNEGFYPAGDLLMGMDGNIYGMTGAGGVYGNGTLFAVSLAPLAPTIRSAAPSSPVALNASYTFIYNATGVPAPTFSLVSGSFPTGLSLTSKGVLSGVPSQAGTYTGTASASNGVGTAATQDFSITVQQIQTAQTISAFNVVPDQTYGSGPLTLIPPTASSGLPVTVTVQSGPAALSGNILTFTGTGIVTLVANQAGNTSYFAAPAVTTSFKVNPATQTINAFPAIANRTYGVAPFTITFPTASSALAVSVTIQSGPATISGHTITVTGAGTVVVAANQPGNTNYSAAPEVTTSFKVNQVPQSLTAFPAIANKTYGVAPFPITFPTASSGLPVSVTVKTGPATISGHTVTLTGGGTVALAANQAGNANISAAPEVTTSFKVNPATQTLTSFPTISNKTYGAAPFTIAFPTVSSGLTVSVMIKSGPATISGHTITVTGAGTVVVAANQAGNANYSAAPEVTTSFKVNQAAQTISAFPSISNKTYGVAPFNITFPTAGSGLTVTVKIISGPAKLSGHTITLTGLGTVVLAADQAGNTNYAAAPEVTTSFKVTH